MRSAGKSPMLNLRCSKGYKANLAFVRNLSTDSDGDLILLHDDTRLPSRQASISQRDEIDKPTLSRTS
jgi:hypothetical protein